jgi:transcriptional regulator
VRHVGATRKGTPMFQPEHFRVDDVAEMHALMRARPFAALVSTGGTLGLYGTHLPTVLKDEGQFGVIECHLSRANPHWKDLAEGGEALMIFSGVDGYISPNWYPTKHQTGKSVPTWNYAIVHAYGRPVVMSKAADKEWTLRHVSELSDQQERTQARPWKVSDAPESYIDVMLRGIVGFRFEITRLEGKWKMSQNREAHDRAGVVAGLNARASGDDIEMAETVAGKMNSD